MDSTLFVYNVTKEEVLAKNLKPFLKLMSGIERYGVKARQSLVINFDGYNDVADEIYEIPHIRRYVAEIFKRVPYILYYANTHTKTHHNLLLCYGDIQVVVQGERISPIEAERKYKSIENFPENLINISIPNTKFIRLKNRTMEYGRQIGDSKGAKKVMDEIQNILK